MLQLLESTTVKLKHFKTRKEFRGDEDALAVDLSLVWTTSNKALDAFHKRLRSMLFCDFRQEVQGEQAEMELPVDDLPNIQVPGAKYPISVPDFQQVGARVDIAYGIDERTAIVLNLCKISRLNVTPIEGGSAVIEFLVSSSADIDPIAVAPLMDLAQHEIIVKLTMPDVKPEKEKDLTVGDVFGDQPPDAPKLTAEDIFVNQSKPAAKNSKLGRAIAASEKAAAKRQGKAT